MNVIDHVILIPRQPHIIWYYLSDLNNNPRWQENCQGISFLSTRHAGTGVRWRHTTERRRDYIIEITAWYERIGYEYVIVDGAPYVQNKGRIRLQEIAEGTVVEWTFQYEAGGMLGGLRNSLSLKRRTRHNIAESLRNLYDFVMQETTGSKVYEESKSLLRDAPDVDERAQYQPRHEMAVNFVRQQSEPPKVIISEPPVSDEDTKPSATIKPVQKDDLVEPEFLDDLAEEESVEAQATLADILNTSFPYNASPSLGDAPEQQLQTRELSQIELARIEEEEQDIDTGRVSVFDLFGLPKPSETQEIQAITQESSIPAPLEMTQEHEVTQVTLKRTGKRLVQRRALINLRRQ